MCHILLNDPKFFALLLRIDCELAQQCQAAGCPCGGTLHQANYPRKPRGCPAQARTLARWRHWWIHHFAATALSRADGARFMPPVTSADMPLGLLARFAGTAPQSVAQLLVFLSPISVLP